VKLRQDDYFDGSRVAIAWLILRLSF